MLLVDLLLGIILLGLSVYLVHSTYSIYSTTNDTTVEGALKQSMIIQFFQILLVIGLLYGAITTTKQPQMSTSSY